MLRLIATAVVAFVSDAIALIVASLVLDDVALDVSGFFIAVLIFTGLQVVLEPLARQIALKNAPALLGSTALICTLVSLVITSVVSDGLRISGGGTWVLATILVWIVALLARLALPFVIFRRTLAEARNRR